jgi:hypothetical protein
MQISESSKGRLLQVGTWLLGLVFVVAAGLKALDIGAFLQQINRYQLIPPDLTSATGITLILVEAILGICCLAGFQARKVLYGMIILLMLFFVATALRWSLLKGTNCGCFGSISTGGPGMVLLHGLLLISLASGAVAMIGKPARPLPFRWFRAMSGFIAAFLIIFIAQPASTSPSQIAPKEDQLRVFMSATCSKCISEVGMVQKLAGSSEVPPVELFIGADYQQQITDFFRKGNAELKYIPLTYPQLGRVTDQVPKVQLFHAGKVLKEWIGHVPSQEEIREALTANSVTSSYEKRTGGVGQ